MPDVIRPSLRNKQTSPIVMMANATAPHNAMPSNGKAPQPRQGPGQTMHSKYSVQNKIDNSNSVHKGNAATGQVGQITVSCCKQFPPKQSVVSTPSASSTREQAAVNRSLSAQAVITCSCRRILRFVVVVASVVALAVVVRRRRHRRRRRLRRRCRLQSSGRRTTSEGN